MTAGDATLIVNPQADLKLIKDAGSINAVTVRAPIKTRGLKVTTIDRTNEPEVFGAILIHSVTKGKHDAAENLSPAERERLTDIGFLVPANLAPHPVRFSCDLDNPPLDLIPRRAQSVEAHAGALENVTVSPTLRHLDGAGPPPEMRGRVRLANPFRSDRSWLWVDHAGLGPPSIYSYSTAPGQHFDALVPGRPLPEPLPLDIRRRLLETGVAESPGVLAARREAWAREMSSARERLRDTRHVVLPHLVRPLQLAAIRRYYRDLIAEGFLPFGDNDWPNRYFAKHDPIAHFFHHHFTEVVSEIAGERLKPSFPFFASYYPGSDLPPHRDREQCVYSMSILIDHSPEPEDLCDWPIYLQPPGAESAVPISLGIGDAVLFYGQEVLHHRKALADGHSSLWFFFYVPEGFEGPLD